MAAIPNNYKTIPGFTLQTKHFALKFIAGFEKGIRSKILEAETDWIEVMVTILHSLEMFKESTPVETIQEVIARSLENWVTAYGGAHDIKATAKIEEKVFFTPPLGSKKSMRISFTDDYKTEIIFHIKKKNIMKSLKEISAGAVAEHLKDEKDISKLEIPTTLFVDLQQGFRNVFGPRHYKSNINCCRQHREGTRERKLICLNKIAKGTRPVCCTKKAGKVRKLEREEVTENKRRKVNKEAEVSKTGKKKVKCSGCGRLFIRIASHKCKSPNMK